MSSPMLQLKVVALAIATLSLAGFGGFKENAAAAQSREVAAPGENVVSVVGQRVVSTHPGKCSQDLIGCAKRGGPHMLGSNLVNLVVPGDPVTLAGAATFQLDGLDEVYSDVIQSYSTDHVWRFWVDANASFTSSVR